MSGGFASRASDERGPERPKYNCSFWGFEILDFLKLPGELVPDDRSMVHEFLSYCPETVGGIVGSEQTVACYVFWLKKHLGKSNSVNGCEKMNSDGPTKIWDIQGVVNYESQNLKTLSWYRLVEIRVVHGFFIFSREFPSSHYPNLRAKNLPDKKWFQKSTSAEFALGMPHRWLRNMRWELLQLYIHSPTAPWHLL